MIVNRSTSVLLNIGHAIDHLFLLIFATAVGAIATDLRNPRTSVNHSRTNRMSRSSIERRTNSC